MNHKSFFILAFYFLVTCIGAMAQSAATADLHVIVRDPKGAVVRDATVTVRNEARNFQRSVTQNVDGEYQFLQLPPGEYTVETAAPGFARVLARALRITVGQTAELPVVLQVASTSEVVNVSAEAEMVETQRSASGTTVDQQRIDNLPINGRNYINFALTDSRLARDTAPSIGAAPTSGLNFSGQRARSNLVNVDGADAVDNSTNGIRSTVSQEAVQEFQIVTNGYAAEFGRASGGVVNIITRSGGNNIHGTAFGYLRNRRFQAVNPFSNVDDPAYTRVQAGATLSGPIRKDKTFYFFSYETTRRQETGFSNIGANNFGFVPFNTALIGRPFGTVLMTPDQVAFLTNPSVLAAQGPSAPAPVRAQVTALVNQYLVLAGGSTGVALDRSLGPAFAAALSSSFGRPVPQGAFPTSGAPLPASFVGMNSLVGNYPVSEGTSLWSLRLDHRFNDSHQVMMRVGVSPSSVNGIQVNAQGPQSFGQNSWSRTSQQTYRDFNVNGQHSWIISNSMLNDLRFQYARRGLRYDFSEAPGGSNVAVQIAGFAFFGREPFSFVDRTEQRYQWTDHLSLTKGTHTVKFGGEFHHLPLRADFTVNFGGIYNIGSWTAGDLFKDPSTGAPINSLALPSGTVAIPGFTPVQAYGLGLPTVFIQGVGNPHDEFKNKILGAFIQDSWRILPNLTLNYGVRYDVEFTPEFKALNALSQTAQDALGITQGIPRDLNNVAPRIGIAWDPGNDGKTVVRASYGIFYDHPLLGLAFDSDVADGTQAPQIILFGGSPGVTPGPYSPSTCPLNAANTFQGLSALCLPSSFNFLPQEQRFNPAPNAESILTNQQYLSAGVPLLLQPFGFPTGKNFVFAYSNQANLTIERDLGHNFALTVEYNFNGGRHLNRPINLNAVKPEALTANFLRAQAGLASLRTALGGTVPPALLPLFGSNPLFVGGCPSAVRAAAAAAGTPLPSSINLAPAGNWTSAPLVSFFRPSGINPSLTSTFPYVACQAEASAALSEFGLGVGVPVPFSDMPANYSNGTSVYHGLTANLRKRFAKHYEFLASYTWSHAIDDGTDLESPLEPQDNYNVRAERSNSLFDQRHRFVFSGVYQTGKLGDGFLRRFASDWTFAPIVEVSSGRPFNIVTFNDRNFDTSVPTDRPLMVAPNAGPNACGDPVVASTFSPTGAFQLPCFLNGTFVGNLGRNSGVKPWTVFNDIRVSRRIQITERVGLDAIVDMFNLVNRFNVADVNPLYTEAGKTTAAFDPRQFQFALKLGW